MNNDLFEKAPIRKAYVALVIPVVLSMLVTLIYNIVDTYFIARTGDTNIVAGVSISAPIFLLLIALGDLFGIGGSALVARLFGERNDEDAARVSAFAFYASFVVGVIVAAILLIFRTGILGLLGADSETFTFASQYYTWIAIASPFVMISYIPANMLRTEGMAKQGMYGTIIGAVVNIILDPILISALGMGARGAAIATLIGNLSTDIFFIIFMCRRNLRISLSIRMAKVKPAYVGMVIAIGVPACVTNILNSFAQTMTNRFLVPYGNETIAAMGIVVKLNLCVCMIIAGMAFGSQPMIAFNFGAKNRDRLKQILRFCMTAQIVVSAILGLLLILFAPQIIRLFLNEPAVVTYGSRMLRILECGALFMSSTLVINCVCQAFGKGLPALLLSTGRQGYVFIVVLLAASRLLGFNGVIATQFISETICFVMALVIYFKIVRPAVNGLGQA